MIQTDHNPGARRSSGAPWIVVLLALVLTAGCSTAPATPASSAPDPFRAAFVTGNGLLGVPELWKSLEKSTTAALLRHVAQQAAGRTSSWRQSPRDTFAALSAETDPVVAAGLILDAGLEPRGLWTEAEVRRWWKAAGNEDDIDHQAVIVRLTDNAADLPVDGAALASWRALLTGPDTVPAQLAGDLLAVFAPGEAVDPRASAPINFRSPRDAAAYLLRAATAGHRSPDAVNPAALSVAREAVPTDDFAMADLARAYAAAGQPQAAGPVVDAMDSRRLLPDGDVLEVPLFEGTIGSTFRIVRTLVAQERQSVIRPELRSSLVEQARSLLSRDVSHRVAGLALINLLEPGTVAAADARSALGAALHEVGVSGELTSPEQAIGWTSVAEYADALGVRLDFPGISASAVKAWVSADEPLAAVSISRFLLSLARSSQLQPGGVVDALSSRVRAGLKHPKNAESIALFSGALAVHAVTGGWVVTAEQLRDQAAERDGACLGGFDGFVRDLPSAGAACNTDATWFATLLQKELDR